MKFFTSNGFKNYGAEQIKVQGKTKYLVTKEQWINLNEALLRAKKEHEKKDPDSMMPKYLEMERLNMYQEKRVKKMIKGSKQSLGKYPSQERVYKWINKELSGKSCLS